MRLINVDALYKDICDSINQMTAIGVVVDGEWLWAKLNDALDNAQAIEERKTGTCDECKNKDRFDYETPCKKCIRIASKGRDGDYFEPLEGEEHG